MCPRTAAARPTQTVTTPAAIGGATTLLGDATTTLVDWGNTVNIVLTQGTLQSDTEQNVFAGKNAAALGAEGRWEIIQWETAILETDGSYTLSNLLRGRKGTEHNVGLHEVGDVFIALTPTSVIRLHPSTSELDQQRLYKPVSVGAGLTDAIAFPSTNRGLGQECYAPVHIKGSRDFLGIPRPISRSPGSAARAPRPSGAISSMRPFSRTRSATRSRSWTRRPWCGRSRGSRPRR